MTGRGAARPPGTPGRISPARGPRPGLALCRGQPLAFSRVKAACDHAERLIKQSQELVAWAQALAKARADNRRAWPHGQPSRLRREMLHRSEYLRLLAGWRPCR